MAKAPELKLAADLLAEGSGAGMHIQRIHHGPDGPSGDLLLEVTPTPDLTPQSSVVRPTHRLRLAPWDPLRVVDSVDGETTVWVLRRGTTGLRHTLRGIGASFIDLAGAIHLRLPWLMVDRTDLPRRQLTLASPSPVDPFGDHNSRVVRLLLASHLGMNEDVKASHRPGRDHPRSWGVRELAAASGVDRTTTSKILRRLAAWELITLDQRGRALEARVTNAAALIDRWSASYDWTANPHLAVHAPIGDPARFLTRLPTLMGPALEVQRWALTLQAGASLIAPHASWNRLHLYLDVEHARALAEVASALQWPAARDGNLILMQPVYRATAWEGLRFIRKLPIVSTIQLIVDLWRYPLRGREQAEHLLELQGRPTKTTPT